MAASTRVRFYGARATRRTQDVCERCRRVWSYYVVCDGCYARERGSDDDEEGGVAAAAAGGFKVYKFKELNPHGRCPGQDDDKHVFVAAVAPGWLQCRNRKCGVVSPACVKCDVLPAQVKGDGRCVACANREYRERRAAEAAEAAAKAAEEKVEITGVEVTGVTAQVLGPHDDFEEEFDDDE